LLELFEDMTVASTWVQSWGDEAQKGVGCREGVFPSLPGTAPPHRGRSLGVAKFLFCDLKMAYFCEFWGTKFKVFSLSRTPSVGFGLILWQIVDFRAKQWIKDIIIKCCHWARTTNIGLLYPNVRNWWGYSHFHWRPHQSKYWRGCVPGIPGGLTQRNYNKKIHIGTSLGWRQCRYIIYRYVQNETSSSSSSFNFVH